MGGGGGGERDRERERERRKRQSARELARERARERERERESERERERECVRETKYVLGCERERDTYTDTRTNIGTHSTVEWGCAEVTGNCQSACKID